MTLAKHTTPKWMIDGLKHVLGELRAGRAVKLSPYHQAWIRKLRERQSSATSSNHATPAVRIPQPSPESLLGSNPNPRYQSEKSLEHNLPDGEKGKS
jgi:hypothetical protein